MVDVSDDRLERDLRSLIAAGARTEARIVAHLAEIDARRLSLLRGRSLFEYCLVDLRLSDSQAFYRITAARTARKFPIVFHLLESHQLHLTTIALIGKYLTQENHLQLLRDVRAKTKRQVLTLLAARFPKPDVPNQIRKLPPQLNAFAAGPTATLEPLSPASYRLQLNASEALKQKLDLAADLMSHSNPTRDLAVIMERALDGLIEKLKKQRFGQTSRPTPGRPVAAVAAGQATVWQDEVADPNEVGCASQSGAPEEKPKERIVSTRPKTTNAATRTASAAAVPMTSVAAAEATTERAANPTSDVPPHFGQPGQPKSARARRHIANDIRRRLVERDGLRCTYCGEGGERCMATAFLQIHHERAWAKGGPDSFENLRLLCAFHNQLLAEREFGARQRKAG